MKGKTQENDHKRSYLAIPRTHFLSRVSNPLLWFIKHIIILLENIKEKKGGWCANQLRTIGGEGRGEGDGILSPLPSFLFFPNPHTLICFSTTFNRTESNRKVGKGYYYILLSAWFSSIPSQQIIDFNLIHTLYLKGFFFARLAYFFTEAAYFSLTFPHMLCNLFFYVDSPFSTRKPNLVQVFPLIFTLH